MKAYGKLFRYFIVGCASYIFVTGFIYILHEGFKLTESWAFALSLLSVSLINVFVLKFYVFRSSISLLRSGVGFLTVSFSMRGFEFLVFYILFSFGFYYLIASTIAMAVGAVSKYALIKYFVYVD